MTRRETSTARPRAEWPALRVDDWTATRDTLHMGTQIVGKVRLVNTPLVNRWWNTALYVTARGLTTSAIPLGSRVFDIELRADRSGPSRRSPQCRRLGHGRGLLARAQQLRLLGGRGVGGPRTASGRTR